MASSLEVKALLVARLKSRASVQDIEPVKVELPAIMDDALLEHTPDNALLDYLRLATFEHELVLLLAWARVCDARASLSAPQASIKTPGGFGSDRDTPFYKNQKLAETLRARYQELKSRLAASSSSENPSGDITVGDLYRRDEFIDTDVPLSTVPPLPAPILSASSIVGQTAGGAELGSVVLDWPARALASFDGLVMFQSSAPGIYQSWRVDQNANVPQIAAAAEEIFRTTDSLRRGVKLSGLLAGTYYFLLAQRDTSNRYAYSNEVTVIVPA